MTPKSAEELTAEARRSVRERTARECMDAQTAGEQMVYLDVREPMEWNLGHIPGAVHIPRGNLESHVEAAIPRDANVLIYCARGNRSAFAARTLEQMGYAKVASMSDGWLGWVREGGEVEE